MAHVCLNYLLLSVLIKLSTEYYFDYGDRYGNLGKFHASQLFYDSSVNTYGNICCASGQWEANAFVNIGTKLKNYNETRIFYHNGTIRIAFDEVNKKSYINFNVTEFEPGVRRHKCMESTVIKDFAKEITYEIGGDVCVRQPNPDSMNIVCIPANAKELSKGLLEGTDITTYQFSSSTSLLKIVTTPTVRLKGNFCEPVILSYAILSDGGFQEFVYGLDIVDFTRGIQDPSIFVPPKSCG